MPRSPEPWSNRHTTHVHAKAQPQRTNPRPSARRRPPAPRDVPELSALERLCFRHPGERFNPRQIRALLANPNAFVTLARIDGTIAGWAVGLLRGKHTPSPAGRLYALAIHPDFRGRRLGARLANRVLRRLRADGARSFSLEVRATNRPARRLYESLGFAPERPLPDYSAPGLHGLRMRKRPPAT